LVDRRLDKLRTWATADLHDRVASVTAAVGHLALLVAAPLTVVFAIVTAIKTDSLRAFLIGLAAGAALIVAQYTAAKFIRASAGLVAATPTQIATPAIPDCMAILAAIGAVVAVVLGGVAAVQLGTFLPFWPSLAGGLCLLAFAWVSLNPGVANIYVSGAASAGQEAIAVLGYVVKVVLKLVPILFGVGAALGTLELLLSPIPSHSVEVEAAPAAGIAYSHVLAAALTPIMVYVLFLGVYLLLDLANTVLHACHRYLGQEHPHSA
jgi:hypothetical protein